MIQEIHEKVEKFVVNLLEHIGLTKHTIDINVVKADKKETKQSEDKDVEENTREVYIVELAIDADARELLIGYHAKNLKAFRLVIQSFLNKQFPDHNVRLNLDVGEYYKNKLERLAKQVKQSIEEVKLLNEPVEMRPMSPKFRRHIHLIVSEDDGVFSESKGEGMNRRVVIYPADFEINAESE